jgi:hypothetical protein
MLPEEGLQKKLFLAQIVGLARNQTRAGNLGEDSPNLRIILSSNSRSVSKSCEKSNVSSKQYVVRLCDIAHNNYR